MRCDAAGERLTAFIDGETTAAEARELEEHLADCERCRREHEALVALAGVARSELRLRLPTDLREALLGTSPRREMHSTGGWQRLFRAGGWWKAAVPAVAIAAILAVFLLDPLRGGFRRRVAGAAPFSRPAGVVAPRYGEQAGAGGEVVTVRPEMGGLVLGSGR